MAPPDDPVPPTTEEMKGLSKSIVTKREGVETSIVTGTGDGGSSTVVIAVPWYQIILIRAGRVFLQSFLGIFTLTASGTVTIAGSGGNQYGVLKAAAISAGVTALVTIGQNVLELLAKLDQKNPTWRG